MKKFTILILIITISFFRMGIISRADTEMLYYDITWNEGISYNLENGVITNDMRYVSSNRQIILDYYGILRLDNINFHHVLLYDRLNRYVGFYNNYGVNIGVNYDKYLGNITSLLTENRYGFKFVLLAYYHSNDLEIDFLNGYSLNDLFNVKIHDDYNIARDLVLPKSSMTDYPSYNMQSTYSSLFVTPLTPKGNFPRHTVWRYNVSSNIPIRMFLASAYHSDSFGATTSRNLINSTSPDISQPVFTNNVSKSGYTSVFSDNRSHTTNLNLTLRFTSVNNTTYRLWNVTAFSISIWNTYQMWLDKVYSNVFNTTFDNLSLAQMYEHFNFYFENPERLLNIILTTEQKEIVNMVYEYNSSQTDYSNNYDLESINLINPYYYKFIDPNAPEPLTMNFTDIIDRMFNINGFESSLVKMIVSAVIIGGSIFLLAIFKSSGLLMIIVGVITYTGLAIIGWLPQAPILIMALGLAALIIIKLVKGGGGSDEE